MSEKQRTILEDEMRSCMDDDDDEDMSLIDWDCCMFPGFSIMPKFFYNLIEHVLHSIWKLFRCALVYNRKKFF